MGILTPIVLLVGLVLLGMSLAETPVRSGALSPAVVYLLVGWGAAALGTPLAEADPLAQSAALTLLCEAAVLVSLFAVGLRLQAPPTWRAWRNAVVLASAGMVVTIALAWLTGWALLGLGGAAALLLACILAPTDPVLASDVQIRAEDDRDAVRVTLTAEGGLNDSTAYPAVMLALGLLGLHALGPGGVHWALRDLLWTIAGGLAVGWGVGHTLGGLLRWRLARGHELAWDELGFIGAIAVCYALAMILHVSTFMAMFAAGVALFRVPRRASPASETLDRSAGLKRRMLAFGERCERLIEVGMVLFVGAAMTWVQWSWQQVAYALLLVFVVRPLAVLAVVRRRALPPTQRRLVAWFGIRGVGSMYYLALALNAGIAPGLARELISVCVLSIAASIVLHGTSATPLMAWYQQRRGGTGRRR